MPRWKIVRGQRVSHSQIARARELRLDLTAEERMLWDRLRKNRLLGYHFRRQQLIAGYVVDFYCHQAALAIEVDGDIHKFKRNDDRRRDAILLERGIRVIRFTNEQVMNSIDEVLGVIASCLEPTPHRPRPSLKREERGARVDFPMRILALDVGERRIGMAISDPLGMLATPLGTLEASQETALAERLRAIVTENEVELLIIGLPIRTDGTHGIEVERVRSWANRNAGDLGIPFVFHDERFTTRQASSQLRAQGKNARTMREGIDAAAAAVLLQSYLDGRGQLSAPEFQ